MKKNDYPLSAWLNRPIKRIDMAIFVFVLGFMNLLGDVLLFYWSWIW